MTFILPRELKPAIPLTHFPTRHQAFIFRAREYVPHKRIADVLGTTAENVRRAIKELGLPDTEPGDEWLTKGYITVIRRMWHILPYRQLCELLGTDETALAVTLREDDFLDVKLGDKPICEPVCYRELTEEEKAATEKIRKTVASLPLSEGAKPFEFDYEVLNTPEKRDTGCACKEKADTQSGFVTRMIYPFSCLYGRAFDVDSREYLTDSTLEAYKASGINAIWMPAVLYQVTPFPFDEELSRGWERRFHNMKMTAERLNKHGIKLFLYLNEPRSMPSEFFEKYPQLRGHERAPDKVCMCTSTPEVQEYLRSSVELICRETSVGGFFTINRSENTTNCYSHSGSQGVKCNCKRCSERSVGEVIAEVVRCIREGADRVNPDIVVMAWSWGYNEFSEQIIERLPERVVLLSQSELDVPFEIGGVTGNVIDYSMSIIGPGERARHEWNLARARGLEVGAKVQVNTTWEASTVPTLPVYPLVEEHLRGIEAEGVGHIMLGWTLGGYPSLTLRRIYERFITGVNPSLSEDEREAAKHFSRAFREFPFHINSLYFGPQNAGPSSLLFDTPTGYEATMTCFAYDDLDRWRAIYPTDVYEEQYRRLCDGWQEGLGLLCDNGSEFSVMARAAYLLFYSSLCQIRFYRARERGDRQTMRELALIERDNAKEMLRLMNKSSAIGFEAANHYYFSRGQLAEKIISCEFLIGKLS